MRLCDPFAHLSYRSSMDHQAMTRAGVAVVVEPCTWPGQPRSQASSLRDHFAALVGFERGRAGQFGLRYFATLALNPREANAPEVAPAAMNLLPFFLAKDAVVAVGETGYDSMSEAEDVCFQWHLDLAKRFGLPVLARVPAAERLEAVRRCLDILRAANFPPERALVGPNDEETLPLVLDSGCWAGHVLSMRARFDGARMAKLARRYGTARLMIGSGADWDLNDALAVPALALSLRQHGVTDGAIDALLWRNPLAFFAQSGRLPEDLRAAPGAAPSQPARAAVS